MPKELIEDTSHPGAATDLAGDRDMIFDLQIGQGPIVRKLKPAIKDAIEQNIRLIGATVCYGKSTPLEEHIVQMMKYWIVGLLESQWPDFYEEDK
jgi:hypothetical protein